MNNKVAIKPLTAAGCEKIVEKLQMQFRIYNEQFLKADCGSKIREYNEGRLHQAHDTLKEFGAAAGLECPCAGCSERMPF